MSSEPEGGGVSGAGSEARGKRSAARWYAAGAFLACAAVLGVAVWWIPDPRGYGTHEQLGFERCGFLMVTGYPCPTCGMTTAFCHTVRGHWIHAFLAQPAGFVFALATVAVAGVSAWVLAVGRWPAWVVLTLSSYRIFVALLALLLGGWALKILLGLLSHTLPAR